jgi:hypothetical protein
MRSKFPNNAFLNFDLMIFFAANKLIMRSKFKKGIIRQFQSHDQFVSCKDNHEMGEGQNYENQNVENQKELRKPCKPSQRRKELLKRSERRKELITTTKITTLKRTSKVIKTTFDVVIILNAIGKIRTSKV